MTRNSLVALGSRSVVVASLTLSTTDSVSDRAGAKDPCEEREEERDGIRDDADALVILEPTTLPK
jgi:hypothetical protein